MNRIARNGLGRIRGAGGRRLTCPTSLTARNFFSAAIGRTGCGDGRRHRGHGSASQQGDRRHQVALKLDQKTVEQAMQRRRRKPGIRKPSQPSRISTIRQLHSNAASRCPSPSMRQPSSRSFQPVCAIAASIRPRSGRWWKWNGPEKDFRAEISDAYADSPFPLQYHFQIRDGSGKVGLSPGLNPGWQGQPYYFVRQQV